MTEPSGWLDMSRFPDHDPDTVLSADQHGLLTSALAVDDGALPDAVWDHLLAVVVGSDEVEDTAGADDPDTDPALTADDDLDATDLEHTLVLDDHDVPGAEHDGYLDGHHDADGGAPTHPGDGLP